MRRRHVGAAILAALLVMGIVLAFKTIPYYSLSPGSARSVNSLISVGAKAPSHPPSGQVLLTTVSIRRLTVYGALWGWLDPDVDVLREEVFEPPSGGDITAYNAALMADSQQIATLVALRQLCYPVKEKGTGALIETVYAGSPADGLLTAEDVIVGVDGTPVTTRQQAIDVLRRRQPGDVTRVRVLNLRTDQIRTVSAKLVDRGDGVAILGVRLRTIGHQIDLPFKVEIDAAGIGGPSAGLAFTLGVIDRLTPGELTGGIPVAVTGAMSEDGAVELIGGVRQKTAAVRDAGTKVFIVPKAEEAEARSRAGSDLRIVGVETIGDALKALQSLGGDPVKGRCGKAAGGR